MPTLLLPKTVMGTTTFWLMLSFTIFSTNALAMERGSELHRLANSLKEKIGESERSVVFEDFFGAVQKCTENSPHEHFFACKKFLYKEEAELALMQLANDVQFKNDLRQFNEHIAEICDEDAANKSGILAAACVGAALSFPSAFSDRWMHCCVALQCLTCAELFRQRYPYVSTLFILALFLNEIVQY